MSARSAKPIENCFEISTILHGDDSQLVLLVYPNKEGLVLIMEDTSSIGPIPVEADCLKVAIAFLKQEMIFN
jgi:hypothetical protein